MIISPLTALAVASPITEAMPSHKPRHNDHPSLKMTQQWHKRFPHEMSYRKGLKPDEPTPS